MVDDVIVENEWGQTWRGENLILEQNNGLGVLCLATEADLLKLATYNVVYVDGTFKSTPDLTIRYSPYMVFISNIVFISLLVSLQERLYHITPTYCKLSKSVSFA